MSRISMESGQRTGDECGGFRSWEEDMYWSHFRTVQFFRILTGRFNQHLAIPNKFVNKLRKKLGGNVGLQGPSGHVWNVGITAFASNLYFKNGWKEFVQDNSLEEDDVLIFKYTGDSRFEVLMFDRKSSCEKEGSYFMKRCKKENVELDTNEEELKDKSPASVEVSAESSLKVSYESPALSKKPRKDDTGATSKSAGQPMLVKTNNRGKNQTDHKGLGQKSLGFSREFVSNGRLVTNQERQRALKEAIALAAETEASFVMNMIKSHVHKVFYVSIPVQWARKHLPYRSQYKFVNLVVEGNTWQVKFDRRRNSCCGLATGWKNFATENYLEESDALVFSLVDQTTDSITFNVRIFRVVEKNIKGKQTRVNPQGVIVGGLRSPQLNNQR